MLSQYDSMTEQEMFQRYGETRSDALRNHLLEKYLYIAEIVAKKFMGRGVEYDDLFQVASLALVKAVDRYLPSYGVKFVSFATPTLVGEIKNYFRDKTRMIRISRRDSELIRKLEDVKGSLTARLGRSASPEEVAAELSIPVERVLELMETRSAAYASSLESCTTINEDLKLIKLLGSTDDEYERIEDRDFISKCMAQLGEVEKRLLHERYAQGKSQREVAAALGVSQMYVSRVERKILVKFRNYYQK